MVNKREVICFKLVEILILSGVYQKKLTMAGLLNLKNRWPRFGSAMSTKKDVEIGLRARVIYVCKCKETETKQERFEGRSETKGKLQKVILVKLI